MSIKCLKESILQGCASASGKGARKHHKDPHFYSTEQTKNMNETREKGEREGESEILYMRLTNSNGLLRRADWQWCRFC